LEVFEPKNTKEGKVGLSAKKREENTNLHIFFPNSIGPPPSISTIFCGAPIGSTIFKTTFFCIFFGQYFGFSSIFRKEVVKLIFP
jgi:hypothetical protein